jgi:hypothetical protein
MPFRELRNQNYFLPFSSPLEGEELKGRGRGRWEKGLPPISQKFAAKRIY